MRRFLALTLTLTLLLSALPAAAAAGEPASWAAPAVDYLLDHGVVEQAYASNFQEEVTRREFAYYTVRLYETLSGKTAPDGQQPFADTDDPWVGKAYGLNLVSGTGEGYSPEGLVNREQVATLVMRCLNAAQVPYYQGSTDAVSFPDGGDISSWALPDVKRANLIGVMNGVGGGNMAPKMTLTREQCFVLLYNVLTKKDDLSAAPVLPAKTLQAPVLRYKNVGAYDTGWCEEAYNSSPAVVDLDGDGNLEIVTAAYSIRAVDAATGKVLWRVPSGHDRTEPDANYVGRAWASVIAEDIDGDGRPEIITGHRDGTVSVLSWDGYFKPGWPKKPVSAEIMSVKVADLDGDGTKEIIVGAGVTSGTNVWVYEHDGSLRPGWPQLDAVHDGAKYAKADGYVGYAWGVFNDSIGVGDIDADGRPEILVPSDVPFVCAYEADGSLVPAASVFGGVSWGNVGFWKDPAFEATVENGGWGLSSDIFTGAKLDLTTLSMSKRLTANFTFGKAIVEDLDGDGKNEVVVTGNMYDRAFGYPPPGKYQTLFVLNGDRTRFVKGEYNWNTTPSTGAPLCEDWSVIEYCMPDPVAADLDGDGVKELLFPGYDGTMNCVNLKGQTFGQWPKKVYDGQTLEFASSPAAADVNGDGKKEVIFTTFTEKKGSKKGSLYVCDWQGKTLYQTELPDSLGNPTPNGCLAAPVVRDIDGDGQFEVVLSTYYSALVVYTLPLA